VTDPAPYRDDRDEEPAEGPGQSRHDAKENLPPGAGVKPDMGATGDVDRAEPYGGSVAPLRMEPQPPPPGVDAPDHDDDPE
jgi:hypothetical protein